MPAAGADRARFGVVRRMNDHLVLFLGIVMICLALRAGPLFAGEFVGDAKSLQAARTGDLDGHGGANDGSDEMTNDE